MPPAVSQRSKVTRATSSGVASSPPPARSSPSAASPSSRATATEQAPQAPEQPKTLVQLLDDFLLSTQAWPKTWLNCKERMTDITTRLTTMRSRALRLEGELARAATQAPVMGDNDPVTSSLPLALENSLNTFVNQALNRITEAVPSIVQDAFSKASPPAPATSAAPSSATPAQRPRPPPGPKELEVVISLPRGSRSPARSTSPTELKARVDAALASSGVPELAGVVTQGVRRRADGCLVVRARSEPQAKLLQRYDDNWVKHFESDASLRRPTFTLTAAAVPTAFDPTAKSARQAIYEANSDVIPSPDSVVSVRWLHNRPPSSVRSKSAASIVVVVSERSTADMLIWRGLYLYGTWCNTSKYMPPAMQCYHCQAFGHISKACPHLADSNHLKCARCAGNHAVRDCHCPAATKCANIRTCTHIHVRCANCGGPHKSVSSVCPIKAAAQAAIASRLDNGSAYFDKLFTPPRGHGAGPL
ncbi:hypothetical protein BN946_scf184652.g60 [Trametes cinnabarina]|uniref:CCHC-type domain-containing protein n=1 Tax=Pycnoporus cinnabarinus TaxID=5643 RepID=A0A060S8M5_PYCCI|nr:hypothetical protein BN946_scf184652.g60 [Trametes cinnabarina]